MTRIRVKYPDDVTKIIEGIDLMISDRIGLLTTSTNYSDPLIRSAKLLMADPVLCELQEDKLRLILNSERKYIIEE